MWGEGVVENRLLPLTWPQGRIILEAAEAEASGPGRRLGPAPPGTTKSFHQFGSEISKEKNLRFSKNICEQSHCFSDNAL